MYNFCMKNLYSLSSVDRKFISLVHEAAFSNPFGEKRDQIDNQIAALSRKKADTPEEILEILVEQMRKFLARLDDQGASKISDFCEKDRPLIKNTYLFFIFHELIDDFDNLIQQQIRSGDRPVRVDFVDKAYQKFDRRGLTQTQAFRFFSIFYQIRRAYYFISHSLTGRSEAMKKLRCALWNSVFTNDIAVYDNFLLDKMEDFSTLILGGTGSGKGSAAAAIGRSGYIEFDEAKGCFSENFNCNFISINLSQYPETLIESELFGYRKGAFTGAIDDYPGIFSLCSPFGSLFLDEIGEVSSHVQIKLLNVLQERTFSPVGSHKMQRFKGRVIAATNRSISSLRQDGKFRDDFFYRLCSNIITVPSLKQRLDENPDEIYELVDVIVARIIGNNTSGIAQGIVETLSKNIPSSYEWPGNVRELEQAIRCILITGNYSGNLPRAETDACKDIQIKMEHGEFSAKDLLAEYCGYLYSRYGTYEKVAEITRLDRRTVKKHLDFRQS